MKSYAQFCGAARALDHIGDRWSLLIIRELLLGDASYGELSAGLPGIPTNLLADRLRQLEGDGILDRDRDGNDRRRVRYRLTSLGAGLEPVLLQLIVWGAHWMRSGPGEDRFDPRWTFLALRALLHARVPRRSGTVVVAIGDLRALVSSDGMTVTVERAAGTPAGDATVEGDGELLLGVVSGELSLEHALRRGLKVRGNRTISRQLLTPSS